MAANDLMMRIQLLVDAGKSSAELSRVQSGLRQLEKELNKLSSIRIDLKNQLGQLNEIGAALKRVDATNFTQSIGALEKAYKKLNLNVQPLKDLRDTFQTLDASKTAQSANNYAGQLKKIEERLKAAKKLTLTNDAQPFNSDLIVGQANLARVARDIKAVNQSIIAERKEVLRLNNELRNSKTLYEEQRKAAGQVSLAGLQVQLQGDQLNLKGFTDQLKIAKQEASRVSESLRNIKKESSNLSKSKIIDFGLQQDDIKTLQSKLASLGQSIDVTAIQQARNALISLNDQIKNQKQLVKTTEQPSAKLLFDQGELQKVNNTLRQTNIQLAAQKQKIAEAKAERKQLLTLTEQEFKKVQQLQQANQGSKRVIELFADRAKTAKQSIVDLNQQIRDLRFSGKLAKELQLPDQKFALDQLRLYNKELKNINFKDLRNQLKDIQVGGNGGVLEFDYQNLKKGEKSIRAVNDVIRNLRQQMRVEGTANLMNFEADRGAARNLLGEIDGIKKAILGVKTVSAGPLIKQVVDQDQLNKLNTQKDSLNALKTAFELVAKAGEGKKGKAYQYADPALQEGISKTIRGLRDIGVEFDKSFSKQINPTKAITTIDDLIKSVKSRIESVPTLDVKVKLDSLNEIQKKLRDIKSDQDAFKTQNIVPLDNKTKVYDKEASALKLLREQVIAYNKEFDKKPESQSQNELDRRLENIKAIRSELNRLNVGNLDKIFGNTASGVVNTELNKQIDLLDRQVAFGKLNSAQLNQQNLKRSAETAELIRQEAIGKNLLASTKQQLDVVNQLVSSERSRARQASETIRTGELQSRQNELVALRQLESDTKALLKTEQLRKTTLREQAQALLAQGKTRALDFTGQITGLQSFVNANKTAQEQAKASIETLKSEITARKQAIDALKEQKRVAADIATQKIATLGVGVANTTVNQANLATQKKLIEDQVKLEQQAIEKRVQREEAALQRLRNSRDQQLKQFDDLTKAAQIASREAKKLTEADVAGRKNAIQLLGENVAKLKEKTAADQQAIKEYAKGLKLFEQGFRTQIAEANQRIALGQLNKAQLAEERQGIKDLLALQQKQSKEYQGVLQGRVEAAKATLNAEKARIALLEEEAKSLKGVEQASKQLAIAEAKRKLTGAGGLQQNVQQQIRETQSLAEAELKRLAALERIANQSQKSSLTPTITATNLLIKQGNDELVKFAQQSELAKKKLNDLGSTENLPKVNEQIKQIRESLKDFRSTGITNLSPSLQADYANQRDTLANLRQQQQLLREIANLDTKSAAGKQRLSQLNSELANLQRVQAEMSKLGQFIQGFGFALTPDQLGMSAFNAVIGVVHRLGQSFIEANSKAETLIRGLDAVFGKGVGDIKFEVLIDLANKYGLGLQDLSRNYLSLNASAKGTILEGIEAEKIFKSLSSAMAVLGADTVSTQRAFRAVGQIISKGQVYAEELKQQLAESLPGAIQLFARSMGKTTQEFLAMVKAGQVGLNELIPFFQLIEKEYGAAATASTTFEQATNRLGNAFLIMLKKIGDTGVWKELVSIIDVFASHINDGLDSLDTSTIKSEIKGLQKELDGFSTEIKIPTQIEFNNLKELDDKVSGKTFKIYGQFVSENYEQLVQHIQSINALNKEQVGIIKEQIKERQQQANAADLSASNEEIANLRKTINAYQEYSEFSKKFVEDYKKTQNTLFSSSNIAGLVPVFGDSIRSALQIPSDSEIKDAYENYKKQVIFARGRLQAALRENERFRLSASEGRAKTDAEQSNRTKKQIAETKNLLNIQQQAYYTLSSIQATIDQREAKGKGVTDSLIAEYKSTEALARVYEELAKAKTIEGQIKRNQVDQKQDTPTDQVKEIQKLTLDQLKHALTVARTAQNYNLVLNIMNEMSRIQQEILRTETAQNLNISYANLTIKDTVNRSKEFEKNLRASTERGYGLANSISRALTLTEQQNKLLSAQKVLIAKNAQEELKSVFAYKDARDQAEKNAQSIKQSQQDQGVYFTPEKKAADLAYQRQREAFAAAEEAWAKARQSNNAEEKTQLMEIVKENLEIARTKAIDAGNTYGLKQINDFQTALRDAKQDVDNLAIAQQQAKLNELGLLDVNQQRTKFSELNNEIKSLYEQWVAKDKEAKAATNTSDKTYIENEKNEIGKRINTLKDQRDLLIQEFNKQNALNPIEFEPIVRGEEAKKELSKLRNEMLVIAKPIPQAVEVGQGAIEEAVALNQKINDAFKVPADKAVAVRTVSPLPTTATELFGSNLTTSYGDVIQSLDQIGFALTSAEGKVIHFKETIQAIPPVKNVDFSVNAQQAMTQAKAFVTALPTSEQANIPIQLDTVQAQQNIRSLSNDVSVLRKNNTITLGIQENLNSEQVVKKYEDLFGKTHTVLMETKMVATSDGFTTQKNVLVIEPKVDLVKAAQEGVKAGQVAQASAQSSFQTIKATNITVDRAQITRDVQQVSGQLSQQLQTSLEQQGVKVRIDEGVTQQDADGWTRNVRRLVATQKGLSFPIENFQVQANTWGEIVSEGNRYLRFKAQIEADSNSPKAIINDVKNKVEQNVVGDQIILPVGFKGDVAAARQEMQTILQQLKDSGATNLQVTFDEKTGQIIVTADTSQAKDNTNSLIDEINTSSATFKVYVKYIDEGRPTSSSTQTDGIKRRWGGLIPGYGGGDRVRALLEPGEFVLPKEIVRDLGLANLNGWISRRKVTIPRPALRDNIHVPRFSSGGPVTGQPIVINVPGQASIQVTGSRDQATALANLLTRTRRAL